MTKRLAEHETFGEAELERRAQELVEAAKRIWPGPSEGAKSDVVSTERTMHGAA